MSDTNIAQKINNAKYIIIKIGSQMIFEQKNGFIKNKWIKSIAEDIKNLHQKNKKIVIVCSGAIPIGKHLIGLKKNNKNKLEENQAAAAVGQVFISDIWRKVFRKYNITIAQILLTTEETEKRRRYLNTHNTFAILNQMAIIPIVNENDTIATSESAYGDNDRLAARVATMLNAEMLIILSNVDGLYQQNPKIKPHAKHIPVVDKIDQNIENMAQKTNSDIAKGGMITKIQAAKIALEQGCDVVIADGTKYNPIDKLINGAKATLFNSSKDPASARKNWIAGLVKIKGKIIIDPGAENALKNNKSLLPAGVKKIDGNFKKGDVVNIHNIQQKIIAKGIIAYNDEEVELIKGKKTILIQDILGYKGKTNIIHKDDLVILEDGG